VTESADLRAEAQRLRTFALMVTDPEVLAGIRTMIEELERRAHHLDSGDVGIS
jgi:hypothetical protein